MYNDNIDDKYYTFSGKYFDLVITNENCQGHINYYIFKQLNNIVFLTVLKSLKKI